MPKAALPASYFRTSRGAPAAAAAARSPAR